MPQPLGLPARGSKAANLNTYTRQLCRLKVLAVLWRGPISAREITELGLIDANPAEIDHAIHILEHLRNIERLTPDGRSRGLNDPLQLTARGRAAITKARALGPKIKVGRAKHRGQDQEW